MDLDAMTLAELNALLDGLDARRLAIKAEATAVMDARNRKIAAEALYAREHPTPVMGAPDPARVAALRARAGVAEVGVRPNR